MSMPSHSAAFAAELRAILKEGAEEVLGLEDANALFKQMRSSTLVEMDSVGAEAGAAMARLHHFLEDEYGFPAARGLALRVGRAGFRRALKRWGSSAGLLEPSYRLLPTGKRIYSGLAGMARTLQAMFGWGVQVEQTEAQWTWRMAQEDWNAGRPARSFLVGTLQEYLSWAGSGRIYQVREMDCPDAYLFVIDKKPLDG